MHQIKVLLVQLASYGDCLFVTTVAKQIKEVDYPGCHLTWLIGSTYSQVIHNNHYVDDVIEVPLDKVDDINNQRQLIPDHIARTGGFDSFDYIFITDYIKANYKYWFGTTRSSLFRSYPHKLKINPQPVVFLTEVEKNNVANFCKQNRIGDNTFNVLFECSPQSGQSLMTFLKAKQIAEELAFKNANLKCILSSDLSFAPNNPNVIDASTISWRENAELANFCQLCVGCSSGISWLCTSNWTRPIPFIQIINPKYMSGRISASMKADFRYFGIDTKQIIELYNPSDSLLKKCINTVILNGFTDAKKTFDENDNSMFANYSFIKGALIPFNEKLLYFVRYGLVDILYNAYRAVKPGWFTPKVWIRKWKMY